jgi:hypothetical protein
MIDGDMVASEPNAAQRVTEAVSGRTALLLAREAPQFQGQNADPYKGKHHPDSDFTVAEIPRARRDTLHQTKRNIRRAVALADDAVCVFPDRRSATNRVQCSFGAPYA